MKVFHYARLNRWRDIAEVHPLEPKKKLGLVPYRPIGMEYPPARERYAIFALLSPRPESWAQKPHPVFSEGVNPFDELVDHVGGLLLEMNVDPKRASVVEWAHREGYIRVSGMRGESSAAPEEFAHRTRLEAERAYLDSAVSLDDYLRERMEYVLPEVLIEERVPMKRVRVSSEQPELERKLAESPALWLGGDLTYMEDIPGIDNLRARYHAAFYGAKQTHHKKERSKGRSRKLVA